MKLNHLWNTFRYETSAIDKNNEGMEKGLQFLIKHILEVCPEHAIRDNSSLGTVELNEENNQVKNSGCC